jgi:hypothetical protein
MREIHRPIHSGYESLRHRDRLVREAQFNRRAFPANEQMTALALDALSRKRMLLVQGYSR